MSIQKITYGVETAINKNKYIKLSGESYFLYWNVYNKTQDKWLCYNEQSNEQYLTKDKCDTMSKGYVHLNDGQKVSTIANPGETIVLYAQWGSLFYINYPDSQQEVVYGQTVKLDKHTVTKDGYDFVGWHVGGWVLLNGKQYGYLCYKDEKKNSTGFMDNKTCDKYGYVILPDEAQVTIGKDILYDNVLYAQWERKKEKINDDLSISISDNLGYTSRVYGSSESGYEITDSKFKKVILNTKIEVMKYRKMLSV